VVRSKDEGENTREGGVNGRLRSERARDRWVVEAGLTGTLRFYG